MGYSSRTDKAIACARLALEAGARPPEPGSPTKAVAIGDPQAPLSRFFEILDRHGLLSSDGWLRPEIHLVSMGDHFDWIGPTEVARAAVEAPQLLAWLAAHPPEQVTILAGNHDLVRVGELAAFDDQSWAEARAEALRVAAGESEAAFLARYPSLPTAGTASRDFAAFTVQQRHLVTRLLQEGRLRLAHAPDDGLLLSHAGVTLDDLARIGLDSAGAQRIAEALNDALDAAVSRWSAAGGALAIPHLHQPGDARSGEARGICFHRPANPEIEDAALFAGPLRRRYDPRTLPTGLTQAIGHIRDGKCRKLLGPWARDEAELNGPLRSLRVHGDQVIYARGLLERLSPDDALLLFTDGAMGSVDPAAYELLDLGARAAFVQ